MIFGQTKYSATRIADASAVVAMCVVALIAAITFRDYGLGWDDYTHFEYGGLLYKLYASGFADREALSFVNLYAYGGGFDLLATLAGKVLPFDVFETRRLIGAAVGLAGIFATWRLARALGGAVAGAIAVVLLATCPLYYGNMFINAKDAPFAAAIAFLTLALLRAFEDYPAPSPIAVAMVGGATGLAIGTRVIGGLGALNAAAALLVLVLIEARRAGLREAGGRAGMFLMRLAPGVLLGYAVMALVWPWSVVAPLNPLRAVAYFSHFFEKPWPEIFDGTVLPVPDMPRRYVPTLFLLQAPEIFLLLGLGGIAGALAALLRRDIAPNRKATLVLLVFAALFPILLTVATRPAMYNGIRHFVFLTPPLAAAGGLAGAWIAEELSRRSRAALAAAAVLFLIGIAVPAREMVRLHPYQYTHFNLIAGGINGAAGRYMLDYWGLAVKQASRGLRARFAQTPPAGRPWRVAVCGPERNAKLELGPAFTVVPEAKNADFAMIMGEFYCARLTAPVVVEVEREGVAYARVYDIRGLTITSALSLPP
jgi:Dolichyl-phosphate-mannose-protein mannosyltransferase